MAGEVGLITRVVPGPHVGMEQISSGRFGFRV